MDNIRLDITLPGELSGAGYRLVVHDVEPDHDEIPQLRAGAFTELTTVDGWTCLVAEHPGQGRITAVYRFLVWACVVELHGSGLPLEGVWPTLHAAYPVFGAHGCLLEAVCAPVPAALRPLPPATAVDFTGWTRRDRHSGPEFTADDGAARIAVHVNCAPDRRIRRTRILAELGAGPARVESASFTTAAGEYGALVTTQGDCVETVAWLVGADGDTEFRTIATAARAATVKALLERLLNEYTFGVGDERLRRFLYVPPPGWQGIGRGLHSDWLLPGFPRRPGRITVLPAFPLAHHGRHAAIDQGLYGAPVDLELQSEPSRVITAGSLQGRLVEKVGGGRLVVQAVLRDDRYFYPFRLECDQSVAIECRAALQTLWASTVPIVRPTQPINSPLFLAWTE